MTDVWFSILFGVATIALVAGFVHSAIGFGYAIVALAFLPFLMDARTAHVMLTMSGIPMLVMAAWAYRKGIDWPSLWPALVGAAVMTPVGLFAFGSMSLDLLVRGTGLAIFTMVLLSIRNRHVHRDGETSGGSSFVAGVVGGFLGGAVSVAGPPVAAYALKQGWPPDRFKAFVSQCLLLMTIYKVIGLAVAGMITAQASYQALWATPFSILGIQFGVLASRRIAPEKFHRLVAIALIGVSCMLMYRGSPEKDIAPNAPSSSKTGRTEWSEFGQSGVVLSHAPVRF